MSPPILAYCVDAWSLIKAVGLPPPAEAVFMLRARRRVGGLYVGVFLRFVFADWHACRLVCASFLTLVVRGVYGFVVGVSIGFLCMYI